MINSFQKEYFFLSNFYEAPIKYDGILYRNSEAAYQAQKCANQADRKQFETLNATEAKKLGRTVTLRKDWEDIKVKVMREIVSEKFSQNQDLREKLISTGDEYLEEGNDWGDRIWGTVQGQGQNLLGKILMETREREIEKNNSNVKPTHLIKKNKKGYSER